MYGGLDLSSPFTVFISYSYSFTSIVFIELMWFQCAHTRGRSCPVKEGIFVGAAGLVYSSPALSLCRSKVSCIGKASRSLEVSINLWQKRMNLE